MKRKLRRAFNGFTLLFLVVSLFNMASFLRGRDTWNEIRARGVRVDAVVMEAAMSMRYEEAGRLKEKLELIENFKSKTVITNSHAGDVDVFGYDEMGQNVYISMLHVHRGSIVQGQTIEYKKQLDETREEILAMGIYELREQLGSTTREVIVPFIPEIY